MKKDDCVFCKIGRKEIPANIVYEDIEVLAFLDVNPVTMGHTLIISKTHYVDVFDIPTELLCKIHSVGKELAKKYKKVLNTDGVNLLNASGQAAQQSVFHYHLHLVPRYSSDKLDLWFHQEAQKPTAAELSKLKDTIINA